MLLHSLDRILSEYSFLIGIGTTFTDSSNVIQRFGFDFLLDLDTDDDGDEFLSALAAALRC